MIRTYIYRVLALSGFLMVLPLALAWIVAAWWKDWRQAALDD